ncbi:helix-turn-helix transcriptional regulator [Lelliottia wanjuensis]|uniref:AlpA family transcriptional regulator n=1 Tax=Lelliottia wanjuensis TaxID=3050585 RepID=A0AAP4FRQ6_9ENTR|nr:MULTISPECIES: AlpA family transcriptional regulator [unclassified Lelliottia]MDK9362913.1 AlpA family transcriptional regulator [Lelliottia sp. V106_12]MDK9616602.1 AlpA family transcriptional regulator [Lelliottia sp. V106_9]
MLLNDHYQHFSQKILRLKEVIKKLGISRSTIYDWLNTNSPRYDETFPKQVHLGLKSVGWLEYELDEWLLSRKKAQKHT